MNKFWVTIEYPTRKKRIEYKSWNRDIRSVLEELKNRTTIIDSNDVVHMLFSAMNFRVEIKELSDEGRTSRPTYYEERIMTSPGGMYAIDSTYGTVTLASTPSTSTGAGISINSGLNVRGSRG